MATTGDVGGDLRGPGIVHVPGLDGLRGLAVAAVVLFHAGKLRGGYLGVDLFFVLSGYLITSLLLLEASHTGRVRLGRFWGRRARRLLPALGVMLVGVAAYAKWAADPGELHRIRWDGLATIAYVANWRQIFGQVDYFALFSAPSPLDHTWSLAIEEQFYVVWPLVFVGLAIFVGRRHRTVPGRAAMVTTVSLALAVVSLTLQVMLGHVSGWERVYFGTDTRAFAILLGASLAGWVAWRGPVRGERARLGLEAGAVVAVGVLAIAWFFLDGTGTVVRHGGLALCSVAGVVVVAAVAHPRVSIVGRVVSLAPLRMLGLISYGVYLYHWPIDVWLDSTRTGMSGWPLIGVQVAVTLVAAVASYHLVEQPIRRGARWQRGRMALVPLAGGVAVAVLVVVATSTSAFDRHDVAVLPPGHATTTLIVGDSVGWYLTRDGFSTLQTQPKMRFVNATVPGCIFPATDRFRLYDGSYTSRFTAPCDRGWVDKVTRLHASRVILVLGATTADAMHHDGSYVEPCDAGFQSWLGRELTSVVDDFTAAGAEVAIVTMPAAINVGNRSDANQAANERAAACTNRVRRSVVADSGGRATLVDLEARICPSGPESCERTWGGVQLRPDTVHFRGPSAPLVATWILKQLDVTVVKG